MSWQSIILRKKDINFFGIPTVIKIDEGAIVTYLGYSGRYTMGLGQKIHPKKGINEEVKGLISLDNIFEENTKRQKMPEWL